MIKSQKSWTIWGGSSSTIGPPLENVKVSQATPDPVNVSVPPGNFNGQSDDDNIMSDGKPAGSTNQLGDSWAVPDNRPE